ncbi:T9SS type A sorting domain-containing protein [Pontibacter sp. CAU 1760]
MKKIYYFVTNTLRIYSQLFFVCTALVFSAFAVQAQVVNIPAADTYSYTQDFNTLPASGASTFTNGTTVNGWYLFPNTAAINTITANDGSSVSGFHNYGNSNSTDRAIGSAGTSGNIQYDTRLVMKNTSGETIRHFRVTYKAEIWNKSNGSEKPITFTYAKNSTVDPASSSYTEISVTELYANLDYNGASGKVNGNDVFVRKSFLIRNVNLAPGNEIRFSWGGSKSSWGAALDDVVIEPVNIAHYYNKAGTSLNVLSNWGTNQDGSGLAPLSFTDADQYFHIRNYTTGSQLTLSGSWQIPGINSRIELGNGSAAVTLTITNGNTITSSIIDILANATLNIDSNQQPALGKLAPTSTVIFNKNASAKITETVEFGNVVLKAKASGADTEFTNNIKVNGRLTIEGASLKLADGRKLEVSDRNLELDNASSISNGSATSYIVLTGQGKIRKGLAANSQTKLPVGTVAGGYSPVTVTNSNTTAATVNVSVKDSDLSTAEAKTAAQKTVKPIMSRTWNISTPEGTNANVTLEWVATTDADKLLVDGDEVHLMQFNGTSWEIAKEFLEVSKSADTLSVTYSYNPADVTPQSSLRVTTTQQAVAAPLGTTEDTPRAGDVTVGSTNTVLPVDLLSFTAKASEGGAVVLSWATAQEKNNAYFEVQRSHDGKSFAAMGRRQGKGTTAIRANYSYTDTLPLAGTSYYRLRQVDQDGTFKILPTVVVNLEQVTTPRMTLYPNPSEGQNVRLYVQGLPAGEEMKVLVADMMGKIVLRKELPANGAVLIPATRLKPGMYIVTARSKTQLITQKLSIK